MKRLFVIGDFTKEAPMKLKETPEIGSKIGYNQELYEVIEVIHYLDEHSIYIYLEKL